MEETEVDAVKIAVVDDEQSCLDMMTDLIQDFSRQQQCEIETVPRLDSVSFLRDFQSGQYAAVFMDIYFGQEEVGLAAAEQLRAADSRCLLVFLTSSADFMPEAFSCHAFEYIVKPVTRERVFQVLSDIVEMVQPEPFLELRTGRQVSRICYDDIVSAVSEGHYMRITLGSGQMLRPRLTARELTDLLGGDPRFLLINKGIMVNADCIVDFVEGSCLLTDGERLPVRVRDRCRIEQAARDYHFERLRRRQHRRRP